ncbi:MAG: hypothetical protein HOD16_04915 [Nitrospina sp.]|nr:hypothetical protein [Nitrospina sp.]
MTTTYWLVIGFIGQIAFGARFVIQWLVSEKKGESTIPIAFWYCSIVGSVILLTYAIHREDPVFILGQSLGSIIYVRNLILIDRKKGLLQRQIRTMNSWKIRFLGIALMVLGGFLFVWSVRDITAEWPQIFVGLLSVFSTAMGFGLLIMPLEDSTEVESKNNLDQKKYP